MNKIDHDFKGAQRVSFEPKKPIATFEDEHGDTQIIHRPKGRRLSVFRGGNTPVLRMNRAAAILMGQKVRDRRLSLGISQRDLCMKAGFIDVNPKQRISQIERSPRSEGVRIGTLYALAHALQCNPGELLPTLDEVLTLAGVAPQNVSPLSIV